MPTESTKSGWQRPENWVTYGVIAIGALIGLKFLDSILPLVNRVLELVIETTVNTAIAGGLLALVSWLVLSNDLHRLGWYAYKKIMKGITQWFIDLDPISIMKTYVVSLKMNLTEIAKSLSSLRGQANALEEAMANANKGIEQSMNLAAQAQKKAGTDRAMKQEVMLKSRKAGRLEQSTKTYSTLLSKLRAHIAVTEKIQEAAKFMIADIEDTVEEETRKRNMIQASYKAMTASRRILASDAQREMYDMALESLTTDYNNKLGEIQQFMEDSQSFITSMDLQNGVYEEEALAKIDAWQKRSENLLEGGTGATKFRVPPAVTTNSDEEDDSAEEPKRQSYADLFDKM